METKIVKFRDLEKNSNDKIKLENFEKPKDFQFDKNLIIELDSCPICGSRVALSGEKDNWYACCFKCGTTGPKHWNWICAARMWNSRDPKVIDELKEK